MSQDYCYVFMLGHIKNSLILSTLAELGLSEFSLSPPSVFCSFEQQ
jgi:hypothetical protein